MSRSNPGLNIINTIMTQEEEFYKKTLYLSYSSLQTLLFSPTLFYHKYVLGNRENNIDKHLVDGKIIHCLLLDNGSFNKQFIVSPANIPTGNNRIVIDKVFSIAKLTDRTSEELKFFDATILEVLKEIDLHQSSADDKPTKLVPVGKTGDQKRIDKIVTEENINYFNYLKQKGGRDIIDEETLTRCKEAVAILSSNTRVRELLYLDNDGDTIQICNECEIKVEPEKYPFGLKGILDNHIIDSTNKTIYINDLKTSGKTLTEFEESIEYFKYYIQAAIYINMISNKYNIDSTWKIVFNFIVIDKYQQVYCFEVSEETKKNWDNKFKDALEIANYHYTNKSFKLPYQFCIGKVLL